MTPEIEKFKYKQFAPVLPDAIDGMVVAVFTVALVAATAVYFAERYARSTARREHLNERTTASVSPLERDPSNAEAS
jgi:hypothetical protein